MSSSIISYQLCPSCASLKISIQFKAKDYTISNAFFEIWECGDCTLRFTQHVPDVDNIAPYYKSENYVSHSDTQEGLVNKLYHRVRNITLKQKRKLISDVCKIETGKLLDVGAGTGAFLHTMKQANWDVLGLEPDNTAREVAQNKYAIQLLAPNELFSLSANQFDCITMWHVLEHVHNLHGYLEQYFQILKEEGRLVIAVPNYTSYDAYHYGAQWAAYDVPRHLYHFSPASMKVLAEQKGFEIKSYHPMWFDSVYVSMLSEKYKHGKPSLLKATLNGLISNLKATSNLRTCSSVIYVLAKKK